MSPEQASGGTKFVGPATDVYSLGAILYECISSAPPFRGDDVWKVIRRVIESPPDSLRVAEPSVPRDLEVICLKCLEKEPRRRYPSAAALADDLTAFLEGRPIVARRVGGLERAWMWGRRNPIRAAAMTGAVLLTFAAIWGGLAIWAERVRSDAEFKQQLSEAELRRRTTDLAREAAEHEVGTQQFAAKLRGIGEKLSRREPGYTAEVIDAIREVTQDRERTADAIDELRGYTVRALVAPDLSRPRDVAVGFTANAIAYDPLGRFVALGEYKISFAKLGVGEIRLIALDGGKDRSIYFRGRVATNRKGATVQDGVRSLAISNDGRWLASGTRSGILHLWDLHSEPPKQTTWDVIEAIDPGVRQVAFAPDGSAVFVGTSQFVKRFDLGDLKANPEVMSPLSVNPRMCVHPREGWLCCVSDSHEGLSSHFTWFNSLTLRPLRPTITGHRDVAGFSGDGSNLWIVPDIGGVDRITARTWLPQKSIPSEPQVHLERREQGRIAVHPTRELLTVGNPNRESIVLWDTVNRTPIQEIATSGRMEKAFSPDGHQFAVTGEARTRVYDVNGERFQSHIGNGRSVVTFALWPDGRGISCVTGRAGRYNGRWFDHWRFSESGEIEPGPRSQFEDWPHESSDAFAFAPNRRSFVHALQPKVDPPDCYVERVQPDGTAEPEAFGVEVVPRDMQFAPNGHLWVVGGSELYVDAPIPMIPPKRWSYTKVMSFGNGRNSFRCVSPGNRWAVAGADDGSLHHFPWPSFKPVPITRLTSNTIRAVALSPDESISAVGTQAGELFLVPVPGGNRIPPVVVYPRAVSSVAWCSNEVLAVGTDLGNVHILRREGTTLRLLFELPGIRPVDRLEWHADGVRLFALHREDQAVRVWHLDRLCDELRSLGLANELEAITRRPLPEYELLPDPPGVKREAIDKRGLRCRYFANIDKPYLVGDRIETAFRQISRRNPLLRSQEIATGHIESTGWLVPSRAGRYTISLDGPHGGRLWIDGHLVIDTTQIETIDSIDLGRTEVVLGTHPHSIRVETFWNGDVPIPMFVLSWMLPGGDGIPEERIPFKYLFPDTSPPAPGVP